MPKAVNSKKRKRENKKDEEKKEKKAKLKENDGRHKNPEDTNVSNLCYDEQQEIDDIDEKLEQNAAKNNLTTINVKSILHHVVSDKRVLAMVKSAVAELEDEQDEGAAGSSNLGSFDVELDFAPKMTRAKSKQANQGDPIAALASQSPIKELRTKKSSTKKKINFTDLELPDSSSDEEYNPNEEEDRSDEDTESCVSFTSDLASPQFPGTPEGKITDGTKDQEDKTVTRSLSKKLSQEPFKVPYPVTSTSSTPVEEITVVEEGDLIAKRTRSQLPLQDVPIESIEATFQPPDFTADMYDTVQEDDLDFEEIEWQKWLQGLTNSGDICGEEDHDDSEYNFMAEDQKEEKEEYRNDRAVRITQKEVIELLDELLKDYDENEDVRCLDDESEDIINLEMLSSQDRVEKKVQFFNARQLERLSEQLQQHTQLLTQIFLMAREDDSLSKEAQLTRDYVNELKGFQDRASNAQLFRGLGDGMVHASAFSFPGLEQAVETVNSTYIPKRRTSSPRKCNTPKKENKDDKPVKTGRRSKTLTDEFLPPLSETNMKLMATNKQVFRFVELLPHHNLLPRTGDTPKQLNGLRVKFTDAEDNLLALGMKELGKKFELIQEHLLPVKSPKQLQIRCKNLLSARAPENIIKYYRRNKELWELPTRIQVFIESNGRRVRVRDSMEPEWLINYKRKQKEHRESQEKSEALAIQQSIEGAAYGRPIVPKFTRGTYTVALPSVPSAVERAQVAWVTITNSASPWNAATAVTPKQPVEHALPTSKVTSARSLPVVSVSQENVNQTNTDPMSLPAGTEATQTDTVDSPAVTDEPVVETQDSTDKEANIPGADDDSKSSSTASTSKETSKDNASKESTEKAASESSTAKQATSSKAKASRDKNGGSVTGARVTSKSHNSGSESGGNSRKPALNSQSSLGGNYILEPDPKFRNRAHAFAEGFLAKVKKQLSDDPVTYEEFLRTLALCSAEQCSPVDLYRRVEVVLAQYPSLVEDFVGFLEPHQAVEAGVFMANLEFVKARTFLRKLEVHFQRTPSQFRKIINAFDSWNKKSLKDPLQLQQTVVPMLKGQTHLIEEFHSFFGDLKPPVCSDDDFEEIEFGSGSEPEVDDFEEVVIPCFVEPKKVKGRPAKDTLQRNSNTRKTRKPCATVKGTKQQGNAGRPLGNRTKVNQTKTNTNGKELTKTGGKQDNPPGKSQGGVTRNMKCVSEISGNEQTTGEERGDHKTEGPLSVTTSLQSETSNDSYRGEESNLASQDTLNLEHEEERERRNTDSEEQEDDGNSDVEHDGYEEDDDDDYMDGDDIDCDVIRGDADAEASGCDSDANVVSSSAVVSAKNLQRSQDGKVVFLWTREDDREILQACQKMGAKQETFQHIANGLKNKTADEVKKRFMDLLNLFQASSSKQTGESTNDESCSEEEDEEDSETVGESEGEQPALGNAS